MKKIVCVIVSFFIVGFNLFGITPEIANSISKGVFEVVIPKVENADYEYDKPLPFDHLPFHIRNDKYYSVGTAFLLDDDVFITAAHVFDLMSEHHWDNYFIRDNEAHLYKVTSIHQYSYNKDFVVFSVEEKGFISPFVISTTPTLNQTVYAVGNALGEGIISREGLLTSMTPEPLAGEWKWLRFSAAASPGNSGGPLLNENGDIIGLVARKSENENLNYAVPMSEVLSFPKDKAIVKIKPPIVLGILDAFSKPLISFEETLPKSIPDLKSSLYSTFNMYVKESVNALLAEEQDVLFPSGNADMLLNANYYSATLPLLIGQGGNKQWQLMSPQGSDSILLGDEGSLSFGNIGFFNIAHLILPESVFVADVMRDPVALQRYLLKTGIVGRQFQEERVLVESLGKPYFQDVFVDDIGRKWLLAKWSVEYMDNLLIASFLPTPEGVVILYNLVPGAAGVATHTLKVMASHIVIDYHGSLQAWSDFLASEYVPDFLSSVHFDENSKDVLIHSPLVEFPVPKSYFGTLDDLFLTMYFTYDRTSTSKKMYSMKGLFVSHKGISQDLVGITKRVEPKKGVMKDIDADWENVQNGYFPYDGSIYMDSGLFTSLEKLKTAGTDQTAYFLFSASTLNGQERQLRKKVKKLHKKITINTEPSEH